jgi:hypothetical protein
MNNIEKQLLGLLSKLIFKHKIKLSNISIDLLQYINQKYGNECTLFDFVNSKKGNNIFSKAFFVIDSSKGKLLPKRNRYPKKVNFISENNFESMINKYDKKTLNVVALGSFGHFVYDKLIEQESKEFTHSILSGQRKILKKQTVLIGLSVFIAAIALIISTLVGVKNINLMNDQSKLISAQLNSISPLKPTLEVNYKNPEDAKISIWEISDILRYKDGNQNIAKKAIRFKIDNIGRMSTGQIRGFITSNKLTSTKAKLANIPGETSAYLEFEIWNKNCYRDYEKIILKNGSKVMALVVKGECDLKEYTNEDIIYGWNYLHLTIECQFCDMNKRTLSFDYCVYYDDNRSKKICEVK